jgi:hypothetical protein
VFFAEIHHWQGPLISGKPSCLCAFAGSPEFALACEALGLMFAEVPQVCFEITASVFRQQSSGFSDALYSGAIFIFLHRDSPRRQPALGESTTSV